MKRRKIKDTKKNREGLDCLLVGYIVNEKKKSLFIKVSNGDFNIIKEILDEWK